MSTPRAMAEDARTTRKCRLNAQCSARVASKCGRADATAMMAFYRFGLFDMMSTIGWQVPRVGRWCCR